MRKHAFLHRLLALLTALLLLCAAGSSALAEKVIALNAADYPVTEDGWYLSMEEVAVYLATFDHLPDSFIKKNDAMRLGWDSRSGNLDHVAPGKAIGGDRFGNYEGTLPDQNGRRWTECDVNYDGGYRDSQRIVFSNDGLMYYTLGQRRGLGIGGHGDGRSYFVVEKDLQNNRLIVAQGEDHPLLYSRAARIEQLTWIDEPAKTQQEYGVKTRYRQPDQRATLREMDENGAIVEFAEAQRAVTPGQSLVIYQGDVCLGGGIIAEYYH